MSSKSKANILFTLSRIKFRGFGTRDLTKFADKFQWINKERLYWARRFDVPMSEAIPEGFPASTADIQLVLSLLAKEAPEKAVAMTQIIYRQYWGKCNPKVLSPDGFSVLLEQELGSELAENLLAQVSCLLLNWTMYAPDTFSLHRVRRMKQNQPWMRLRKSYLGLGHLACLG